MKSFIAVVALASVASAQVSFGDIPASILTCLTPVASTDGCGLTDFACQCKVTDLITKTAPCIAAAPCADQQKGQSVLSQLCSQNGVPVSIPSPTCGGSASSAAPTSSAAAVSSAASSAASAASSAASAASSAASAASAASSASSLASSLAASATSAAASSAAAASQTGTPASYSAGAVPMATQAAGLIGAAALAMLAL